MKKLLFAAICIIGFQSSSIAQESQLSKSANDTIPRFNLYVSFGASFNDSYKLNDKLGAQGLPQLADVQPDFTVGFNVRPTRKFSFDLEMAAAYSDEKDAFTRVRTTTATARLRPHYVAFDTGKVFGSVGVDLSYAGTQADIFSRGNQIDLNNLNPALHNGHISLRNGLIYAGPSVAFGFLQNMEFPLRLNFGYEWAITNGKWRSDFADVTNTVKESGHGRAYAKLTIGL